MRTLVWFRSDLRTIDNAALSLATRQSTRGVVGVFIISPSEWRAHDVAPVKLDLMLRSLAVLRTSLEKLRIPLLVRRAETVSEIPSLLTALCAKHECDALAFNKEYEVNESRRDARVLAACKAAGVVTHACTDQSIIEPGEVRTGEGRFFTVYSPFKRAAYKFIQAHDSLRAHPAPKAQATLVCTSDDVPTAIEGWHSDIDPALWPAGEHEAQRALEQFIQHRSRSYKVDRDFPALPGTSALSPHLAIGTISPRQCVLAAYQANADAKGSPLDSGNEGLAHWISEVLWREFYIHILVGYPRVCMHRAFQLPTEAIRWNDNPQHFEAWCQGKTGVPIVDAGMRQLRQTGWMHNRLRMVTAMYLTKNLFIDWKIGEKWFMQHLVDGFLASNNGGWQWSASTGTDAAPYFRIMNPVSQSQRFDPKGDFLRQFVPELAGLQGEAIHEPWELPGLLRSRLQYPEPLVDLSKTRQAAIDRFAAVKKQ
jgi:deoxyribodipyrimidine photo-lyase